MSKQSVTDLFTETENRVETVISQLQQVLGDLKQCKQELDLYCQED